MKQEVVNQATKKIAVGIVLYNPNIDRLNKSLKLLSRYFNKIILYNNKVDITEINILSSLTKKIDIIGTGENMGIAYGLNEIMSKAKDAGYEWVLTLDQDSLIPDNLAYEYSKYLNREDIAIICPQVIDKRRKYEKLITTPELEYITMCITSGSCTNIEIWDKIGRFDSWLFIDLVDNDFCKRVILSDYKILKLNSVVLDHEYGTITSRSKFIEKLFINLGKKLNSVNIAKLSFKRSVNPMRIYYENRNVLYLNKKFKDYGGIGYENHHCRTYIGFFITFSVYSLLVGKNKKAIIISIIKGIHDGKNKEVECWSIDNHKKRIR